jgi:hypothetical protein
VTAQIVPNLEDALQYVGKVLPETEDGSENAGFVVVGSSAGQNVLFWTCEYIISGAPSTQWIVPDARFTGTIFMAISSTQKTLGDNEFARSGTHIPEYRTPGDMTIRREARQASWELSNRVIGWTPPTWHIGGTHAGVEVDLTCRSLGSAAWRQGPFEDVVANRAAGYDAPLRASGTIRVAGRTYSLEEAYGSHERAVMGQGRDIIAEAASPSEVFVADCFGEDLHVLFGQHTGREMNFGAVTLGDQTFDVAPFNGLGTMSVTTVERWADPRSGLVLPARWRVVMAREEFALQLDVQAIGRAYWHYTTSSGVMVMVWQLSRASGELYVPGAAPRALDDLVVASRWGRTILVAEETLDGPRFVALESLASAAKV